MHTLYGTSLNRIGDDIYRRISKEMPGNWHIGMAKIVIVGQIVVQVVVHIWVMLEEPVEEQDGEMVVVALVDVVMHDGDAVSGTLTDGLTI